MNCTPFVRQYGILFRKWGVFAYPDGIDAHDLSEDRRALPEVLVKIPQKTFFFPSSFFVKTSCACPPKML